MSGDNGAIAVARVLSETPLMEDFRYSATRTHSVGCQALAEALGKYSSLKRLDLADLCFGDEAAEALASSIVKHKNIEFLNFRDSGFGEDGSASIFNAIGAAAFPLKYLDMSGNDLTPEIFSKNTIEFIASLSMLEYLYLDDNSLTSEGALEVAKFVPSLASLKVLSLCCCELTASGAYAIAKAVIRLTSFQTLQLDGNEINDRGVERITCLLVKHGKILGGTWSSRRLS